MKKLFLLFLFCGTSLSQVSACEICGCGVGNFYLGMVPKFNNKFIGIRYRTMHFKTKMRDDPTEFSNDYYQTVELWSGWNLGKRFQVMAFVPYQFNERRTDDGIKTTNGIGDIIVLANFIAWKKTSERESQQLWIGVGIKLPTGQYKIDFEDPKNNLGDPNGQAGTGSIDLLLSLNHTISFGKWGINSTANYKINTINPDNFRFGNRFSVNSLVYYQMNAGLFNISPVVGVLAEHSSRNNYKERAIAHTRGSALFTSTGLEVSYSKLVAGITLQSPLAQNFAESQTKAELRGMIHLVYTF